MPSRHIIIGGVRTRLRLILKLANSVRSIVIRLHLDLCYRFFKDMQLGEKSLVIWREVNNQMVKLARPIFYPLSNKLQRLEFVKGV